jgi:hypothetical protein
MNNFNYSPGAEEQEASLDTETPQIWYKFK